MVYGTGVQPIESYAATDRTKIYTFEKRSSISIPNTPIAIYILLLWSFFPDTNLLYANSWIQGE
jgi:hypothetical protein